MLGPDPDQLARGMELMGLARDDMERVRCAPTLDAQLWALADLKLRAKARSRQLIREWHPDTAEPGVAEARADDLRAVIVAAEWVADLEARPQLHRPPRAPTVRVERAPMGVRVTVTDHEREAQESITWNPRERS